MDGFDTGCSFVTARVTQLREEQSRLSRNHPATGVQNPPLNSRTHAKGFDTASSPSEQPGSTGLAQRNPRKTKRVGIPDKDAYPSLWIQSSDSCSTGSVTSSRTARGAESPLRMPILVMRVQPPLRSWRVGAISSNSFATTSLSVTDFNTRRREWRSPRLALVMSFSASGWTRRALVSVVVIRPCSKSWVARLRRMRRSWVGLPPRRGPFRSGSDQRSVCVLSTARSRRSRRPFRRRCPLRPRAPGRSVRWPGSGRSPGRRRAARGPGCEG